MNHKYSTSHLARLKSFPTQRRTLSFLLGTALLLMLIAPSLSRADPGFPLQVEPPASVGIGQPFLVRVSSTYPLDDVSLEWDNRTIHPQIDHQDALSRSIVLLGTAVSQEPGSLPLIVTARAKGRTQRRHLNIDVAVHAYQSETLSVPPRMVTPPESVHERIERDRERLLGVINAPSAERMWTIPFQLPVKGKKLSRFGLHRVFNGESKQRHKGLDFRAPLGTAVKSIAAGRVALVGDFYYGGNMVVIDHGNGVVSSYAHLSEPNVTEGEAVSPGQQIGLSGATGRVTGAHLHLSVYVQGRSIDPDPLFTMTQW